MKLIMENWKKFINEAIPKLNPPSGAEDPTLMGYGEFAKDRPRPRRTQSIRAYSIEQGIDLLNKNLDNLTADIEMDPNNPIPKEVAAEMVLRGYEILKSKLSEPEKSPEEMERFKELDKKLEMVQKRIRQLRGEADTLPG